MINLLPPKGKKAVKLEYYLRVATTYLFLLSATTIVVGTLFVPTMFYIWFQMDIYRSELSTDEAATKLEMVEEEFTLANDVSDLLLEDESYRGFKEVYDNIFALTGEGVEVNNISATKNKGVIKTVSVSGKADDRNSLIAFRDRLNGHEYFDEAKLPISDLAQNKMIQFSIEVTTSDLVKKPYED